jgi:hypothetical protein
MVSDNTFNLLSALILLVLQTMLQQSKLFEHDVVEQTGFSSAVGAGVSGTAAGVGPGVSGTATRVGAGVPRTAAGVGAGVSGAEPLEQTYTEDSDPLCGYYSRPSCSNAMWCTGISAITLAKYFRRSLTESMRNKAPRKTAVKTRSVGSLERCCCSKSGQAKDSLK